MAHGAPQMQDEVVLTGVWFLSRSSLSSGVDLSPVMSTPSWRRGRTDSPAAHAASAVFFFLVTRICRAPAQLLIALFDGTGQRNSYHVPPLWPCAPGAPVMVGRTSRAPLENHLNHLHATDTRRC